MKLFITLFLLFSQSLLLGGYEEGKAIFKKKCSSCHSGSVDLNTLKINFFEKENRLLNLKAPTVNMLEYAIMRSPKKIGDPLDEEMRQVEIEEFLKEIMKNPNIEHTICDSMIVKNFPPKKPNNPAITDEEAVELSYFFMEYKKHEKKSKKNKNISSKNLIEKDILTKAKDLKKNIIINVSSKNCYFCKKMKKEVLSLKSVEEFIENNYLYYEIMIEETNLPFDLKKHYKEITPTFFVLSSDGKVLNSYPGAWKKEDFLNNLKENLK